MKKITLVVLIVANLILLTLVVLMASGTINFKFNLNSQQITKENNNNINNNKNESQEDKTTNDNPTNNNISNNEFEVNIEELNKFGSLTYNILKQEFDMKYSLNLFVDGKVNISFEKDIDNISNAKDINLFSTPSPSNSILYILTIDGYIYKYDLSNYELGNYSATKIEEYNNIKKMITYRTRQANAGGCDYIILIDNNRKYYKLDSSCV